MAKNINETSSKVGGSPPRAFLWLILFVLTFGHPEKADTQKIGNRKTDIIVYALIVLLAGLIVIYGSTHGWLGSFGQ